MYLRITTFIIINVDNVLQENGQRVCALWIINLWLIIAGALSHAFAKAITTLDSGVRQPDLAELKLFFHDNIFVMATIGRPSSIKIGL